MQFDKDDDIVTCPECGTPHHRDCYKTIGHCVNKGLHKTEYSFLDAEKPSKTESQTPPKSEYYTPADKDDNEIQEVDIISEAKIESNATADDNSQNSQKGYSPFQAIQFDTGEFNEKGEIDGVDIQDIAATIRSNAPRFVSKFKEFSSKNKKTSWNWGAFFFGSFYLLFRKMYKQGTAFFSLFLTTIITGEAFIIKFAPKYIEAVQSFVENYSKTKVTVQDVQNVMAVSDANTAQKIVCIMLGVILVLRIIQAIFADYFYKNTVFDIIKKVDEQLENGANFTQTAIFFGQTEQFDQNQMKRLYLGNKGGVSFFAPFTAYFIIYIILMFI